MNQNRLLKICGFLLTLAVCSFFIFYIHTVTYQTGVRGKVYDVAPDRVEKQGLVAGEPVKIPYHSEYEKLRGLTLFFAAEEFAETDAVSLLVTLSDARTGELLAEKPCLLFTDTPEPELSVVFDAILPGLSGRELSIAVTLQKEAAARGRLFLKTLPKENGSLPLLSVTRAGKTPYSTAATLVATLVSALVCAAYLLFAKRSLFSKLGLPRLYLIFATGLGLLYMFFLPVGSAPDEPLHLYKAYEISNQFLGVSAPEGLRLRADDAAVDLRSFSFDRTGFSGYYGQMFSGLSDGTLVEADGLPVSTASAGYYLLPALGITLGRLLGLGTTLTLLLGRLFSLALFTLSCFLAVKLAPFAKSLFFVWGILPITLQQAMSYSYDSPVFSACVLVTALSFRLLYAPPEDPKKKLVLLSSLIFMALLLFTVKEHALAPVSLLALLLIPKWFRDHRELVEKQRQRLSRNQKLLAAVLAAGLLFLIGLFAVRWLLRITRPENMNTFYVEWAEENAYSFGYLLTHPGPAVFTLMETFFAMADTYLSQLLGGALGWVDGHDYRTPLTVVLIYGVLLVLASVRKQREQSGVRMGQRLYCWLMALLVCGFAVMGMWLQWTPMSSAVILGVQGRYFLPALLCALPVLRSDGASVSEQSDRGILFAAVALHLPVVVSVFHSVV